MEGRDGLAPPGWGGWPVLVALHGSATTRQGVSVVWRMEWRGSGETNHPMGEPLPHGLTPLMKLVSFQTGS